MSVIYTGDKRSLTVVVYYDEVVTNTYYGQDSFEWPLGRVYPTISNAQLNYMTEADYNDRLRDFKLWVESQEEGLLFTEAIISESESTIEGTECVDPTTINQCLMTGTAVFIEVVVPTTTTTTTTNAETTTTTTSTSTTTTTEYADPIVETETIVNYSNSSVIITGRLVSEGTVIVNKMGFVYNLTGNPTYSDSVVEGNAYPGPYDMEIAGLESYTTYYFRAFVTDYSGHVWYGEEVEGQTLFSGSTIDHFTGVTSEAVVGVWGNSWFTSTKFSVAGTAYHVGADTSTDHALGIMGIYYKEGLGGNPSVNGTRVDVMVGGGAFEGLTIQGLTPNTDYIVCMFIEVDGKTILGNVLHCKTLQA